MTEFLRTFATGSFDLLLRVFLIVIPIMVVLEVFEGTRAFRAVVRASGPGSCVTSAWMSVRRLRHSSASSSASPTAEG